LSQKPRHHLVGHLLECEMHGLLQIGELTRLCSQQLQPFLRLLLEALLDRRPRLVDPFQNITALVFHANHHKLLHIRAEKTIFRRWISSAP
jgi:hypothetical protein